MTARSLFSIMFGNTVNDGALLSPVGKTSIFAHSLHVKLTGAWIACFTSARSKYSGSVCAWEKDPGKPRTSQRTDHCHALVSAEVSEGRAKR